MSAPQKLHRAEYVQQAQEFASKITMCSMEPRVPPKFRAIATECSPSHDEACLFETVKIEDMKNEYDAKPFGERKGWTFIGCGMGRCTFAYKPKCVIKFARSGRREGKTYGARLWWGAPGLTGEDQNTYEVATYNQAEDEIKELLVPIIAHSPTAPYKWIALPKVKNYENKDFTADKADSLVNYLERELPKRNAQCQDIHEGNVGMLEDNPVMLDYGFGLVCKRRKVEKKPKEPKKLSEFFPAKSVAKEVVKEAKKRESRYTEGCENNDNCPTGESCVNHFCKQPIFDDVEHEIHRVILLFQQVPNKYQANARAFMEQQFKDARALQNRSRYLSAMDAVEIARLEVERLIRLGAIPTPQILKPSVRGKWTRDQADILKDQARILSNQGRSMDAAFLRARAEKILKKGRIASIPQRDEELLLLLLDDEHKRQIAQLGAKAKTAQKFRTPKKCNRHSDCPTGMMCVKPKFVTHPRYCKNSSAITREDVIGEIARVNKRYHEIPPTYRTDVKDFVDERLKNAELEMNTENRVMALFYIEEAEKEIEDEKSKLKSIGVSTWRGTPPKATKHKGRHGLKRPRGEAGGMLTQRRRALWAQANALRKKAKKITRDPIRKDQLIRDARFLEQQAWHYQTKALGKGGAQLTDPQRMLQLLTRERREKFAELEGNV